ncbi:hypothetical protein KSC_029630 [Ktedonobacter sp. SOSP1-52]|uniref:hypothetical protein n=1 Tax=Ktedonobacter sp. SOSP1-52 TaxID=2778366 RepID=UPI001915EA22|nr:hypothetical protein [Ktedonobacter sp. SOSP1-52]GHO64071.1 hypothetical protein KSC_029630 [Ktedonobacter sp. SOSP1-52]
MRPFLARLGLFRLQGKSNGVIDALPAAVQPMARAIGLRSQAYDWIFGEAQALEQSEAQIRSATAFPPIPLIVLAAARRSLAQRHHEALLARASRLSWLTFPRTALFVSSNTVVMRIQLDQPQVVIDALRDVVNRVRASTSSQQH